MFKSLFEQLKSKVVTEPAEGEDKDRIGSVTQLSADKIKAVIAELVNAEPIFNQAGFVMDELDIEVGIVPKLTPKFKRIHDIDKSAEEELFNSLQNKRLIRFLLISLLKSAKIKNMLEGSDMHLHVIEIDITAVPSVRSTFKRHAPVSDKEAVSIVPANQQEPTKH